jgi:protein-S-isoprenylcysteine O-methyltransferase Ste14
MSEATDHANVVVLPPIAWAAAILVGLGLHWLYPLPFLPAALPHVWAGAAIFILGVALAVWATTALRRAGTRVEPNQPTTAIVAAGPYRFSRNPIYVGMLTGQIGLAIAFDSLWLLVALVPLFLVLRYGVVAREEAYLGRKFGDIYRAYKASVRRWL